MRFYPDPLRSCVDSYLFCVQHWLEELICKQSFDKFDTLEPRCSGHALQRTPLYSRHHFWEPIARFIADTSILRTPLSRTNNVRYRGWTVLQFKPGMFMPGPTIINKSMINVKKDGDCLAYKTVFLNFESISNQSSQGEKVYHYMQL